MSRPSLVIYGNCQAEFLGLLLSQTPQIAARFDVVVASNNLEPAAALSAIAPHAERTVLYWEQVDTRPEDAVRDPVRRALRDDRMTVRYPTVAMLAFWPFFAKDPRNRPEPGYPFGRYPAGDRIAMEVAEMGIGPDEAFDRYMEISRKKMIDVPNSVLRDLDLQARRDSASDVAMCDFVSEHLRSTYQFWARAHLATCVLRELLVRLLEKSSAVIGADQSELRRELEAVCERFPGQGEFQHPIHPLVIEQLGLRFVHEDTKYRWFSNTWTFEEHMKRYIAFDRSW